MRKTLCLLALLGLAAHAQDRALENTIGDEMTQRKPDATVWLEAGSQKFAALMVPAITKTKRGGIILVHGADEPPDARNILTPISQKLPERGWDTLAIQAALPEQGSLPEQHLGLIASSLDRIESAVNYLQNRKSTPVALLGVGTGAVAALRFAAEKPDAKLAAIVIIDPPSDTSSEAALLADLAKTRIPALDVQSNRSKTLTQATYLKRKRAAQENPRYRQTGLIDATAGYSELEDMMTNRIGGWLMKETPEPEQDGAAAKAATPPP